MVQAKSANIKNEDIKQVVRNGRDHAGSIETLLLK